MATTPTTPKADAQMDYQKKKLLTQSVAYLQANLTLSTDLLRAFQAARVLTDEEVSTIQKEEIGSGKVIELVCLIKRKDNRTYNKFLQVLEERQCTAVASLLKTKSAVAESRLADKRTVHFLQQYLGDSSLINQRKVNDLALNLVLKEIYKDDIAELQEKLTRLQRSLPRKSAQNKDGSSDSGSERSTPVGSRSSRTEPVTPKLMSARGDRGVPQWDVPTQAAELQELLHQKDDIIKKKDQEYSKLRNIVEETQNEMQGLLDLNSQYLTIISQLNQMQLNAANTPRLQAHSQELEDLQNRLEESESKIAQLEEDLDDVSADLADREAELHKVLKRELKYKDMLGLDQDDDEDVMEQRIREIVRDGSMNRKELDKIVHELNRTKQSKTALEERVHSLMKEKEKVEFHLRQQDLTIKKINRMKTAKETLQQSQYVLRAHGATGVDSIQMKLPAIERPGSQLSLASSKANKCGHQYCMFCRSEFQPLKSQSCCRSHFRPLRHGKWTCCRDESHRSAGCLQLPHLYIEITVDKKIFITDGARYMELS